MVVEIDKEMKQQLLEMFGRLDHDVTLHLFIKEHDCLYCNDTQSLVEQLSEISDKITLEIHEDTLESDIAKEMGVKHTPATVVHGKEKYKIRFYGIPAGHEFGALVGTIVDVSSGVAPLPPDIIEDIVAIDKSAHIRVFTTPQCPYCPNMVRLANQAALLNPLIEADMVESLEFNELAQQFEVFGVPKTVINDSVTIEGLATPEVFVEKLFDATE